jgi:phenylalanyl-tRNA synthetase alpha chain
MASGENGRQGDLPSEILVLLSQNEPILSAEAFPSQKSADVKSALDKLASRSMIKYDTIDREVAILEDEGVEIEANGSHEARVFEALRKAVEGLTVKELEAAIGDKKAASVGQGKAFKSKWIAKAKDGRLIASVRYCIVRVAHEHVTKGSRWTQLKTQRASNYRSFKKPEHIQIQKSLQI